MRHRNAQALDRTVFALRLLERRISKIEDAGNRSWLGRLTEDAGAIALFLGLVLSVASLYDILVRKPEADRLDAISKFNAAVNSAAQVQQEVVQAQIQTTNPALALAMTSAATPRVLNDIATARALLTQLKDDDVGIPQLIVLMSGAFTTGDLASAGVFAARAVEKRDATPYLHAEALRYQGRLLFASERASDGRAKYDEAVAQLGDGPFSAQERAYVLADLVVLEFGFGDCAEVDSAVKKFSATVQSPGVSAEARQQLVGSVQLQINQNQGRRCVLTAEASRLIGLTPQPAPPLVTGVLPQ